MEQRKSKTNKEKERGGEVGWTILKNWWRLLEINKKNARANHTLGNPNSGTLMAKWMRMKKLLMNYEN